MQSPAVAAANVAISLGWRAQEAIGLGGDVSLSHSQGMALHRVVGSGQVRSGQVRVG
eukprot:COSAG05_NODE_2199_length_3410_cov_3.000906_2_plen_57_part_00